MAITINKNPTSLRPDEDGPAACDIRRVLSLARRGPFGPARNHNPSTIN
jgi:hypothetical protein